MMLRIAGQVKALSQAAIRGSSPATVVAIGSVVLPAMMKQFSVGVLATTLQAVWRRWAWPMSPTLPGLMLVPYVPQSSV